MSALTSHTSFSDGAAILVVDDLTDSRELVTNLLTTHIHGVTVTGAPDGQAALALASSKRFDLILLDVCMPGLDGFAVCERLKENPATANVPVLMLSGAMVETAYRCRGLDHGADGYLCKPFENAELVAQARALLRAKHYQDQLSLHKAQLEEELNRRTATLCESEQQLRILFEESPDAVLVEDTGGKVMAVNAAACRLYGMTKEQLVDAHVLDLVPPELRETASEHNRHLVEGTLRRVESESLRADGRSVPVEIRANAIQFNGKAAVLLHVRDITERRRAIRKQQTTTADLRSVVESADELMGCPDVRTIYRRAVELARERLGFERCSIFRDEGEQVRGTYGTNLRGETTDEFDHVQAKTGFWASGFEPLDRRDAPCRIVIDRMREWDGTGHRVLHEGWMALTPIVEEGHRPPAVFLNDAAISGDAPDPQKQEILAVYCSLLGQILKRRQAEERYRTLVEQLPAITYVMQWGTTSRTTYISPQVESLLGFTPEEWQAEPDRWVNQLHSEDRESVVCTIRQAEEAGGPFYLDYRVLTRHGEEKWFRNHAVFVQDDTGKSRWLHGVMLDITDRVLAETRGRALDVRLARAKRMESLGLLAGGVAHDLNNILGPLVAYPELILSELEDDSPVREDIAEVGKSAQRAAEVIQDLLTLARRGRYELEPVDLVDVTRRYLESAAFQVLAREHEKVTVETDLAEDLPAIQGSSPHLVRSLANLVTNAMEAMPDGGHLKIRIFSRRPEPEVPREPAETAGEEVVVTVSDTGEGMTEDDLEHIFEPFYTKRKLGRSGTGIGLAVVYGVVRDLHGEVDVKSRAGEGSEFALAFPATAEAPARTPDAALRLGGTESILVVDDVREQRELATRILTSLGYQVASVENGHRALELLRRQSADLLVLDMIMEEDFDGLDTYREIIREHPDQRCLIVSGYAETSRVLTAQALGAGSYLRKPYTVEKLGEAVRLELDKRAAA